MEKPAIQENGEKNKDGLKLDNINTLKDPNKAKNITEGIKNSPKDTEKLLKIINKTKQENNAESADVNKDIKEKIIAQFDTTKENITTEKKSNGYEKVSITDKLLTLRSEPEVAVTIKSDGKLNIHVNPYSKYDKYYFIAENISADQFSQEKGNIENIRKDLAPSEKSIFKKKDYPNVNDINPNDYI